MKRITNKKMFFSLLLMSQISASVAQMDAGQKKPISKKNNLHADELHEHDASAAAYANFQAKFTNFQQQFKSTRYSALATEELKQLLKPVQSATFSFNCQGAFVIADELKNRNEGEYVKSIFNNLIERGVCLAESNLILANVAYFDGDYQTAAKYFKRAFNHNAPVSHQEHADYVESLFNTKQFVRADNEAKIALRDCNRLIEIYKGEGKNYLIKAVEVTIKRLEYILDEAKYAMKHGESTVRYTK